MECSGDAIDSSDKRDYCQALLDWGQKHQARIHPALDLFGTGPYSERGVVAREAIPAGEVLFYIPVGLTIQGPLEAHQGALGDFYRKVSRPLSNVVRLALTMIHELHVIGQASHWWPYLDFLAGTVKADLLFLWPADSLKLLEGTMPLLRLPFAPADEPVSVESVADVFSRDVLPIMVEGGDLWPSHVRREELFWQCLSLIMSRGRQGGLSFACDGSCLPCLEAGLGENKTGPFLTPMADLLNHSSHPDVRNTKWGLEDGAFVVRALRDIACDEEVLQSYGEHGDGELLRTYGFVEGDQRGNPNNSLLIAKEDVLSSCRQALEGELCSKRLSFLEQSQSLQLAYRIPSTGNFPKELLTVVQALLMGSKEFGEFENCGVRFLDESFHVRDSTLGGKVAACAMLLLARTRKRYGADVTTDSAADDVSEESQRRRKMALKVREGELLVLKAAQSYIITKLAPQPRKQRATLKRKRQTAAGSGNPPSNLGSSKEKPGEDAGDPTSESKAAKVDACE